MLNFIQVVLCTLFFTLPALAGEISESTTKFSVGVGAGLTVFEVESGSSYHPATDIAVRAEWSPWRYLGLAFGGSHSAFSGDNWHAKEESLSAHAQIHPFGTAVSNQGWDHYVLLGASEIFHSFSIELTDYSGKQRITQWQAGLGTNYKFSEKFGAWAEIMGGREFTGSPLNYGTNLIGHVGIKYFF